MTSKWQDQQRKTYILLHLIKCMIIIFNQTWNTMIQEHPCCPHINKNLYNFIFALILLFLKLYDLTWIIIVIAVIIGSIAGRIAAGITPLATAKNGAGQLGRKAWAPSTWTRLQGWAATLDQLKKLLRNWSDSNRQHDWNKLRCGVKLPSKT